MSRVATNYPTTHFNNGFGQTSTSLLNRSSSNSSMTNSIVGGGRGVTVRSAAPPPAQKETVHACPLCNEQYKDPRVLPCTHTFCLNCIREKLITNNRLTCPKCHHQAHPFEESDLNDLQRNLILSQEWRLNTRPVPTSPAPKKPVTYTSIAQTPMPKQQDKRKSSVAESNGHESTHSHSGISGLVHAFSKATGGGGGRSSRSASVASNAPSGVSNLVRIYSEATTPKQQEQPQQQQPQLKPRSDSVMTTGKHDELARIFEQVTNRSQRPSTSSGAVIKRSSQSYEEVGWESVGHGTIPVAPSLPEQWQSATEHHHQPPEAPERPISAASSLDRNSNVDNLRDIVSDIQQRSNEKTFPSFPQVSVPQVSSRPSTASRSRHDSDSDDGPPTPVPPSPMYATVQPSQQQQSLPQPQQQQQYSRQGSYADSVRSAASSSTSRQSPAPSLTNNYQLKLPSLAAQQSQPQQQQQQPDDRISNRSVSIASSSRRSVDRFPPPPPPPPPLNLETLDLIGTGEPSKPRSTASMSTRSSAYADVNETNFLSTERFNPDTEILAPIRTNNSSRAQSQISSRSSTPTNRPGSKSLERDVNHLVPTPSSSINTAVTSRVDSLLNDQKRLERDIEDQMKRLKHDYDDVRKQIDRKQSSIQNEVKNIAVRLDEDITEHYRRKQKIYTDLAADTNSVGTELERLKSSPTGNTNKQQLWDNLEQIELNIRKIRQAVEQQKEPQGALTFSEGHRTLGADTIGQITYHQAESRDRFNSPPPPLPNQSSSFQKQQTSMNITPYKYIKFDHLAALEPEAIAITENNKKILLGICNKLFILDEHGTALKTIPLAPSIRGITVSKKPNSQNIAYVSHDETVSIIDIDSGQTIDCVKETDSTGESGTFLPLGIDTDNIRGDVYVCDYRNSCVIKFDDKLEFITQWRIYNHSKHYDEARPKLISVHGQRFYMIVEHSCKPYYNQGIAYTFSLHICDANSGSIIKIIDADLLGTQRLRWPCSVQAITNEKCYILDTMTSGKYFNGHWQKHWSRVLEIGQDENHICTELFQLDSEAATMAMTKQNMIIAANGDILFVDLAFLKNQFASEHEYQNLP